MVAKIAWGKHLAVTRVVKVGRANDLCVLQCFLMRLTDTLHEYDLVIVPNALDCLICCEVRLLSLSMPQIILPEAFKEQGVLLVHQEALPVAFVLLQHSNVSCTSLNILKSSHAIVVTCLEFTNVFCVL